MHSMHIDVKRPYASGPIQSWGVLMHIFAMQKRRPKKHFLREWRKSVPGRTLESVASQVGVSQPQLGRIERGDSPYKEDLLERLAEVYECSVLDLLFIPPGTTAALMAAVAKATPEQIQVITKHAEIVLSSNAQK